MPNEVEELQNQVNKLKKDKRRLKRWVSFQALSLTGIVVGVIINNWLVISPYFVGSNYDDMAIPKRNNFRRGIHLPNRSMGVYYKPEDVSTYLGTYWVQLLARQKKYQDSVIQANPGFFHYERCKWVIGFYWMEKDRKNMFSANRHDFYVIPTLLDTLDPKNPVVVDYFEDEKRVYYHGTPNPKTSENKARVLDTDNAVAFDEGQLWP